MQSNDADDMPSDGLWGKLRTCFFVSLVVSNASCVCQLQRQQQQPRMSSTITCYAKTTPCAVIYQVNAPAASSPCSASSSFTTTTSCVRLGRYVLFCSCLPKLDACHNSERKLLPAKIKLATHSLMITSYYCQPSQAGHARRRGRGSSFQGQDFQWHLSL